jgi:hypothetical protein
MHYGSGTKTGSFIPVYEDGEKWFSPVRVSMGYKEAYIEIPLAGSGGNNPPRFEAKDQER